MLAGYIDVFIKEKYMMSDSKDNSALTIEKLKQEWNKLVSSWELYKIKMTRCQIGDLSDKNQESIENSFQNLNQEMLKITKKN